MATKNKIAIGIAGEALAEAVLARMGYVVAITRKNTPAVDILVSNGLEAKIIQVKTTDEPKAKWVVGSKVSANINTVFVFVKLDPSHTTDSAFYIVPSNIVKAAVQKEFRGWKARLKAKGEDIANKKGMYHFADPKGLYLNKWEHLGLPLKKPRKS
jgi:hypothetical protein